MTDTVIVCKQAVRFRAMFAFLRVALPLFLAAATTLADNRETFQQRIAPILEQNCGMCHSGGKPQGDLSISTYQALLTGGKHGPAIRPGASNESLLIGYLRGSRKPQMPLGGELPADVIEQLAASIDEMEPIDEPARFENPHFTWLFRKPASPPLPKPRNGEWARNAIDAFILEKLEAKGLAPAPEADRRVLIRRLYFDLIGLPSTPEEVQRFLDDDDPNAWENLIDDLLARSEYGERWARHWLDLVRYAESDGFAIDTERPTAWRYRDYVVRAFNQDKPYDLFIKEQLAGDELAADEKVDPAERLVAMGFLRMGPWEADAISKQKLRQDVLNELTGVTGSVFLGLTIGCAQCHDHKYDPLPQRDFYRLQAFFAATRVDDLPAPYTDSENRLDIKKLRRSYEDKLDAATEVFDDTRDRLIRRYVAMEQITDEKDERLATFKRELNVKNEFFRKRSGPIFREPIWSEWLASKDEKERLTELYDRHRPIAVSVSDVVPPHVPAIPVTHTLAGGELDSPGEKVEPGFPESIVDRLADADIPFQGKSSGRRLALAEWIADADNPLTARVMVNRIWQQHFGHGILRTTSDLGRNGDRPTHPELLDWLATQFVEQGWSIKAMHRLMLNSASYRQSAEHPTWEQYAEADPDNRLLWRMNWRRLDAETIRDTLLTLSGRLNPERGGPGALLPVPDDVAQGFEFFKWFASPEEQQLKRTIYTFQRRSVVEPFLETFDVANMSESCARRNTTTVAPQALTLLNGRLVNGEAPYFAARVMRETGGEPEAGIDRAFRLVLGRRPSGKEKAQALGLLAEGSPAEALARLSVVLVNLNEFLYVE